jgi:hypothetical protein
MHEHFINLLVEDRCQFERMASKRDIDSISDFVSGYSNAIGLFNVLSTFREWLGVELAILKPSPMRGGIWIGASINWQHMLLNHYSSRQDAYEGFFTQYREYVVRSRRFLRQLDVSSPVERPFYTRDFGHGFPDAIDVLQIDGHDGVYAYSVFKQREPNVIGHFSTIEEVEKGFRAM